MPVELIEGDSVPAHKIVIPCTQFGLVPCSTYGCPSYGGGGQG